MPPSSEAVHCNSCNAQCPHAVWQLAQELHDLLPLGSEVVHCRSSTTHYPQAVRHCVAGIQLPTSHGHCGGALQQFHYPLPPSSEVVHYGSSTAHCPRQ